MITIVITIAAVIAVTVTVTIRISGGDRTYGAGKPAPFLVYSIQWPETENEWACYTQNRWTLAVIF